MGNFLDLDTPINEDPTNTLRVYATSLRDSAGKPILLDIDKGSKFRGTLLLIQTHHKDTVTSRITTWVEDNLDHTVDWNTEPPTRSGNYSMDANSKSTIQKFAEVAEFYDITDGKVFPVITSRTFTPSAPSAWHRKVNPILTPPQAASLINPPVIPVLEITELKKDIKTLWKNQYTIRCKFSQLDVHFVEAGLSTMTSTDHLYDVTKEIQDATVRLSKDRFRQAKINRLQAKYNVDPGRSVDDGTLAQLNDLLAEDWHDYTSELARINQHVQTNPIDHATTMSKEEEVCRRELLHKTEVFQRLAKSDPPGRIIEFGFEEGGDDYSILTGSTYIDTSTEEQYAANPMASDIIMGEAQASFTKIDKISPPGTSLSRAALSMQSDGPSKVVHAQSDIVDLTLSPTILPSIPDVSMDVENDEAMTVDSPIVDDEPSLYPRSPPMSSAIFPSMVVTSRSQDTTEEWICASKKNHGKAKLSPSRLPLNPGSASYHATLSPLKSLSGQGSSRLVNNNRFAALDPEELLNTSLKHSPGKGIKWYDDCSDDDDPNNADSSSAYEDNNSCESDDDLSMTEYDPSAPEVTDLPFESEADNTDGYETDTTCNRSKRSADNRASPLQASSVPFLDKNDLHSPPSQVRISATSMSTPHGLRQLPDLSSDTNATQPLQTQPLYELELTGLECREDTASTLSSRSSGQSSSKSTKKHNKSRGVSRGPAHISKLKQRYPIKRKSVDPDQIEDTPMVINCSDSLRDAKSPATSPILLTKMPKRILNDLDNPLGAASSPLFLQDTALASVQYNKTTGGLGADPG
jgi:hypothetical protein